MNRYPQDGKTLKWGAEWGVAIGSVALLVAAGNLTISVLKDEPGRKAQSAVLSEAVNAMNDINIPKSENFNKILKDQEILKQKISRHTIQTRDIANTYCVSVMFAIDDGKSVTEAFSKADKDTLNALKLYRFDPVKDKSVYDDMKAYMENSKTLLIEAMKTVVDTPALNIGDKEKTDIKAQIEDFEAKREVKYPSQAKASGNTGLRGPSRIEAVKLAGINNARLRRV